MISFIILQAIFITFNKFKFKKLRFLLNFYSLVILVTRFANSWYHGPRLLSMSNLDVVAVVVGNEESIF